MAGQELTLDPVEQIMEHIAAGRHFVLNGGAGSGKTYSLVQVLRRIQEQYPTAGIACITFTNAAAIEIRNRTHDSNLLVSTIHSFLWNEIRQFQRELRETVLELTENSTFGKLFPLDPADRDTVPDTIEYREYTKLSRGAISHDQVLVLADQMYSKYPLLCDILSDKYRFILVDEYQDTSPHVIRILLEHLHKRRRRGIVGFFGDAMQAIHQSDVAYFQQYFHSANVQRVDKPDNRRNPQAVIDLANRIRMDGLKQTPSDDPEAPNMKEGKVKAGSVRFFYSSSDSLDKLKARLEAEGWDFRDGKRTKDLRLTHKLIAADAGFELLLELYDKDPVHLFLRKNAKVIDARLAAMDVTFETAALQAGLTLPEDPLFAHVSQQPWETVRRIYLDKEDLTADRSLRHHADHNDNAPNPLLHHLFRIHDLMLLYEAGSYFDVIHQTAFQITRLEDKITLRKGMDALEEAMNGTIGDVIDCANDRNLCIWDDTLIRFAERNEYQHWRLRQIPYSQFQNLYRYQEGFNALSTQHKIKGLEYDNVLLILDNGKWNSYNFKYLLDPTTNQKKYATVIERTKKLFYVCCTRAMEHLAVYIHAPDPRDLAGAKVLFGESNCINLDSVSDSVKERL